MTNKNSEMILRLESYGKYYLACSKWASLFEKLNITWVHHSSFCNTDKTAADFYLSEQGIYFFVDMVRPGKNIMRYMNELKTRSETVVMGGAEGTFRICEDGEWFTPEESRLSLCGGCGKYFFMNDVGSYECRHCGGYNWDHHLLKTYTGDRRLFESVKG